MYCHESLPGTRTCRPPRRLCKNDYQKTWRVLNQSQPRNTPSYRTSSLNSQTYQTPKIGVRPDRRLLLRYLPLRWLSNAPRLATAELIRRVPHAQLALWQAQAVVEDVHQRLVHRERLDDEWLDRALHPCVHGARVRAPRLARPGEGVVFGDVDELDGVEVPVLVCRVRSCRFVSARAIPNTRRRTSVSDGSTLVRPLQRTRKTSLRRPARTASSPRGGASSSQLPSQTSHQRLRRIHGSSSCTRTTHLSQQ